MKLIQQEKLPKMGKQDIEYIVGQIPGIMVVPIQMEQGMYIVGGANI